MGYSLLFCSVLTKKVSLFPVTSKVQNDGFDGQGTNCKRWSRFRCIFDNSAKKSLHIRKMCLSIHPYFVLLLVIILS